LRTERQVLRSHRHDERPPAELPLCAPGPPNRRIAPRQVSLPLRLAAGPTRSLRRVYFLFLRAGVLSEGGENTAASGVFFAATEAGFFGFFASRFDRLCPLAT
jgi:hypothetical protein